MDPAYKKRVKKVPKHMPNCEQAFRLCVVAPSMSGKSYMINDMLTNKKYHYNKVFDPVCTYVFSPTYASDTSYKDLKKKMKGYEENCVDHLDFDLLDAIIERQKRAKKMKKARPTLVLIDDLITAINPRKLTTLTDLFMRGRHHYINIILTSQSYKCIPRAMRLNACSLAIFTNNMNAGERACIAAEMPDDHFLHLAKRLERKQGYNRWDFVYLSYRHDRYNRWYRCWDRKFKVEEVEDGKL
jgi:hypothetical protein